MGDEATHQRRGGEGEGGALRRRVLGAAVVEATESGGDCDSKALLAVMILRQLNVDAAVLLASGLGHAALGVALPVTGKKFPYQGKKYAFVEDHSGLGAGPLAARVRRRQGVEGHPVEVQ